MDCEWCTNPAQPFALCLLRRLFAHCWLPDLHQLRSSHRSDVNRCLDREFMSIESMWLSHVLYLACDSTTATGSDLSQTPDRSNHTFILRRNSVFQWSVGIVRPCVGSSRQGRSRLEAGHATWVIKSFLRLRCHGSSAQLLWWGWLARWLWKSNSYCSAIQQTTGPVQLVAEAHNSPKGGVALEQSGLARTAFPRWVQLGYAYWKTLYFGSFPPGACITLETSYVAIFPCQCLPNLNTSLKVTFQAAQACSIVGLFGKSPVFRGLGRM